MSRGAFGGQRTSSRERLTEEQKRELRQMRKRQRVEHRKRKLIKLDEDGVGVACGQVILLFVVGIGCRE